MAGVVSRCLRKMRRSRFAESIRRRASCEFERDLDLRAKKALAEESSADRQAMGCSSAYLPVKFTFN
jgi:hypothetical protein